MKLQSLLENPNELKDLTDGEKRVAEYIFANRNQIPYTTIQELAKITYTSNSTIIRLCKKLGFDGYKNFIIHFVKRVERNYGNVQTINADIPFSALTNYTDIAKSICELNKETVDKCFSVFTDELLRKLAITLSESKRIFIYAFGDSYIKALGFQNKLVKINKYAVIVTEFNEEAYHLFNINRDDCVIYITYSGRMYPSYEKHASMLRKKGVKQIIITAKINCRIAQYCDIIVGLPIEEDESKKIATFASQMAIDCVLNVLYACAFHVKYKENYQFKHDNYNTIVKNDLFLRENK